MEHFQMWDPITTFSFMPTVVCMIVMIGEILLRRFIHMRRMTKITRKIFKIANQMYRRSFRSVDSHQQAQICCEYLSATEAALAVAMKCNVGQSSTYEQAYNAVRNARMAFLTAINTDIHSTTSGIKGGTL